MSAATAPAPAEAAPAAPAANAPATPGSTAGTSLYVGDLEANVSEAMLYELFSGIGPVVSIRVCRDLITRRSLGYGYINFQLAADANRALDMLNHQVLNNKPIRVSHSQRDPSTRKSGLGNVFIKNLDKTIDNKTLHDTFAQFGNIISAKIAIDSTGGSKGYGFVQYDSADAAKNAIDNVNGMLLKDKMVYVGHFQRKSDRAVNPADVKFTNVYVKNLDESVTDEKLRERFAAHGSITSAVVVVDKEDATKSKCFGFVNFEDAEEAASAVIALDQKEFDGKPMYVGRAQKKSEREAELKAKFEAERRERMEKMAGANLYVKNLDDTVDDEKLRELFKEHGTVTSCRVMKDANGNSRGSGFVAFSSAEEATKAVTEMNNKMIGAKPLYVALAQRKEDRRMRLQAQFHQRQAMGGAVQGNVPMYPPQQMGPPGAPIYYGQAPPGMVVGPPQPQPHFFQGGVMPPNANRGGPMMPPYMVAMGPQGVRNMGPGGQQRQGGRRGQNQQGAQGGRGQGRQQVRYNNNVRNMQNEGQVQNGAALPEGQVVPGMNAAPEHVSSVAMLSSQLAAAPVDQQRTLLGEALYPLVERIEPHAAAKVTGMLLEMDQAEVLHLIESPDALQSKVVEAMGVLKAATNDE